MSESDENIRDVKARMAEIRRRRFSELVSRSGKKVVFAERYGLNAAYVSQLITGHRNMGEGFARSLELKAGLPVGWLDQDDPPGSGAEAIQTVVTSPEPVAEPASSYLTARERALIELFNSLPSEDQDKFFAQLEEKNLYFNKIFRELSERRQKRA
jgi:hypothetical protein